MKKNNKKGFTLAELLIVVAIIAVLVAVAIPVFNAQLEKSREATDLANLRSAYGEAVADALTASDNAGKSVSYKMQQKTSGMDVDLANLPDPLANGSGFSTWQNQVGGSFYVSVQISGESTNVTVGS